MRKSNKKYRIKSKFRFITFIVILLCLTVGAFGYITGFSISTALTKPCDRQIEVAAGDTLWNIANEYKSDKTDPRRAVYNICQINGIKGSDLRPGMVLTIPEEL